MTSTAQRNKQTVERFFASIEAQEFEIIKEIFAPQARGFQPFAPEGFPNNLVGIEGFYREFSGLTARFKSLKFPRTIYVTQDPDYVLIEFTSEIELLQGGTYANRYVATFRFEEGKILEYTEYFNPIILSKTFDIPL